MTRDDFKRWMAGKFIGDTWKRSTYFPPHKRNGARECARRLRQIEHRAMNADTELRIR